jgi:hypothetical protein
LFHTRLRAQGTSDVVQVTYLVPLIGGKGYGSIFICFDILVVSFCVAVLWSQASPAWISSASLSWGGSSLPRASARRRIPKQAVLLK